jgi:hypothetical protein
VKFLIYHSSDSLQVSSKSDGSGFRPKRVNNIKEGLFYPDILLFWIKLSWWKSKLAFYRFFIAHDTVSDWWKQQQFTDSPLLIGWAQNNLLTFPVLINQATTVE